MTDNHASTTENPESQPESQAPSRADVTLFELLTALGEEKRVLIGLPLVAILLAVVISFVLTSRYTATTTFLPPQQQQQGGLAAAALQQLGGLASFATSAAGIKKTEDLYVAMMKSETVRNALITRFDLLKRYNVAIRAEARDKIGNNVSISPDRGGLVRIEATDPDPAFAAELANAHIEELRRMLGTIAITDAQQRRMFLENQLVGVKEALIKAETGLKLTQEKTGLIALDKQGEAIIKAVADLRAQIVGREVQLQAMRNFATPENAEVKRLASEIAGLREELTRIESGQVRGQGEVIVPTGKVPESGLAYIRALREVKYHEALFEAIARQFELAKVEEAREAPLIQQIDVAVPPEKRSFPQRRMIVMVAALMGAVLALVVAFIRIALRRSAANPRFVAQMESLRSAWRFPPVESLRSAWRFPLMESLRSAWRFRKKS